MAKFYGEIGYAETKETTAGVWTEVITERKYSGDVVKVSRRWEAGANLNDDLTIGNEISIVADPYADKHFWLMKYVKWMGVYWKINNVKVERPRLILSLGGVYNGDTTGTTDDVGDVD